MPIKLSSISRRLWPRKFYVRVKEFHPIAGSVFVAIWSILWLILALTLNILVLGVIIISILFVIVAIFSDSSFDPVFLSFNTSSNKKDKNKYPDSTNIVKDPLANERR